MNVKEKFLELTKRTYPHGTEDQLIELLPSQLQKDQFGNYFVQIGDKPTTMFTCHLDTASYDQNDVNHVIKGDMIYTDGKTILGADDKAGVVVLMYMIEHNVSGLYYFFLGEERGCIGSKKVADIHKLEPIEYITKVVSFDRRGYDSVITHQMSGRCCSQEFAKDLSHKLNQNADFRYQPDSTGIYTDSAQFVDIYSECTNISVGYHNEHTKSESQNIDHLVKLCEKVTLINWDTLVVSRDPKKNSYYDYEDEYGYGIGYNYRSEYKGTSTYIDNIFEEKSVEVRTTILDTEYYGHETSVTYDYNTLEIIKITPHVERIQKEKESIERLLDSLNVDFDETRWDGNMLTIKSLNDKDTYVYRNELTEYLTNLNDWIETELKYNSIS
jgi:hypothetical protein